MTTPGAPPSEATEAAQETADEAFADAFIIDELDTSPGTQELLTNDELYDTAVSLTSNRARLVASEQLNSGSMTQEKTDYRSDVCVFVRHLRALNPKLPGIETSVARSKRAEILTRSAATLGSNGKIGDSIKDSIRFIVDFDYDLTAHGIDPSRFIYGAEVRTTEVEYPEEFILQEPDESTETEVEPEEITLLHETELDALIDRVNFLIKGQRKAVNKSNRASGRKLLKTQKSADKKRQTTTKDKGAYVRDTQLFAAKLMEQMVVRAPEAFSDLQELDLDSRDTVIETALGNLGVTQARVINYFTGPDHLERLNRAAAGAILSIAFHHSEEPTNDTLTTPLTAPASPVPTPDTLMNPEATEKDSSIPLNVAAPVKPQYDTSPGSIGQLARETTEIELPLATESEPAVDTTEESEEDNPGESETLLYESLDTDPDPAPENTSSDPEEGQIDEPTVTPVVSSGSYTRSSSDLKPKNAVVDLNTV